jgi:hypothetical protein
VTVKPLSTPEARDRRLLKRAPPTEARAAPYAGLGSDSPPNAYTGDGSLAYLFRARGTKLRAHVGNGYRKPSLYKRFGTFFSHAFGDSARRPAPRARTLHRLRRRS